MEQPITALQTPDCDWLLHRFIEVNFSKLTDSKEIFRNYFVCLHYHVCKISSQIIECINFAHYELSITTIYSMVIVTHSSVFVPRYTNSSLAFAMSATDHINVVLHKFAYSLMSRVVASPNSIVTAIVNSDAYHQSPLMDKWESMLYDVSE